MSEDTMETTGFGICPLCGESLEEIGHCIAGEDNAYFVCAACDLSFMMDFDDDYTCHTIGNALGQPRHSVTDVTLKSRSGYPAHFDLDRYVKALWLNVED